MASDVGPAAMDAKVPLPPSPLVDQGTAPTWLGINLRTAENVCFARREQLLHDYKACMLGYGVASGVIRAWMQGSYAGEAAADGTPEGEGSATMCGGLKYVGRFKRGLMHGQGKLEFGNGMSYEGTFFFNCIHGTGTYRWLKEANYVGEVLDGIPHGSGTMYTGEDGCCTYEGAWMKGLHHGEGSLAYGKEGGVVYHGSWQNGRKHGEGNLVYASGSTYRGGWSEGKRHGQGRATIVTSAVPNDPHAALMHKHWRLDAIAVQIYDGEWCIDLPHGSGKDIWADDGIEEIRNMLRNAYVGNFCEGKRNGQGTQFYASGAVFKGVWKENMKEGPGVLIYEDGKVHSGIFSRDRYVAVKDDSICMKEPLDAILEADLDVAAVKPKLINLLLRYNTKLREVFTLYSYFPEESSEETNVRHLGRPRAMVMEQFWQLCHDARMVEPGFGLAQIDFLLRATPESWDCLSEVHSPKRQLIYREFFETMVKFARHRNNSDLWLDLKVDALLGAHILSLEKCGKESPFTLLSKSPVQQVLDDFKLQIEKLFSETLREIGTSDGTIKVAYLNHFFMRFAPELVANQGKVVAKLISALYYTQLKEEEDNTAFLEYDINYSECELCLLMIATEDTTMPGREPQELLHKLLKDVVTPNLSTNLEVLLNEPSPPPSARGKKGDKGKAAPKKK